MECLKERKARDLRCKEHMLESISPLPKREHCVQMFE